MNLSQLEFDQDCPAQMCPLFTLFLALGPHGYLFFAANKETGPLN